MWCLPKIENHIGSVVIGILSFRQKKLTTQYIASRIAATL